MCSLDGVHFPQSKDNVYLFQEHSAVENIEDILFVLRLRKMYVIQDPILLDEHAHSEFNTFYPKVRSFEREASEHTSI